jgi:phosphoribosylformylglycinamidine (FGAM) synthase PurS component
MHGNISQGILDKVAVKLLANTLVQKYKIRWKLQQIAKL